MAVSDDGDTNRPDFAITYRTWKKYVQTQLFNRKKCSKFFLMSPYYWLSTNQYAIIRYKDKADNNSASAFSVIQDNKKFVLLDTDAIAIGAGAWFPIPIDTNTKFPAITKLGDLANSRNLLFKNNVQWHPQLHSFVSAASCGTRTLRKYLQSNLDIVRSELCSDTGPPAHDRWLRNANALYWAYGAAAFVVGQALLCTFKKLKVSDRGEYSTRSDSETAKATIDGLRLTSIPPVFAFIAYICGNNNSTNDGANSIPANNKNGGDSKWKLYNPSYVPIIETGSGEPECTVNDKKDSLLTFKRLLNDTKLRGDYSIYKAVQFVRSSSSTISETLEAYLTFLNKYYKPLNLTKYSGVGDDDTIKNNTLIYELVKIICDVLGSEYVWNYDFVRGDEIPFQTPLLGVLDLEKYIVIKQINKTVGTAPPIVLQKIDGSRIIEISHQDREKHFALYDIADLALVKRYDA